MRALIIALCLHAFSASYAAGESDKLDCVPIAKKTYVQVGVNLEGFWLSWPCEVDGGYAVRWNRLTWPVGYLVDMPAIAKALNSPDPTASANALLTGRSCDASPLARRLCDAAEADEARTKLPPLWITRVAPWGGVSVYAMPLVGLPTGNTINVIGDNVACDCVSWRIPLPDGRAWCITQTKPVLGVSACHKNL